MVVSRSFEPPDLIVATIQGVLTSHDQEDLLDWVRSLIPRLGSVRLLIHLDEFGGWRLDRSFESPTSWLSDDEGVTKVAFVGRLEWEHNVLSLVAQPLRRLPIRYFGTDAAARRWLGVSSS
jgi:hypothetical protein